MGIVFNCRCLTCGADLSANGSVVSHISSNPTHMVSEVIYDDEYADPASSEGLTKVQDGELFSYDPGRELWLSVNRVNIEWGYYSSNCRKLWLRLGTQIPLTGSKSGYLVSRPAVITKMMSSRRRGAIGWETMICANYSYREPLYVMEMKDEISYSNYDLNIEVKDGMTLHCYHKSERSYYPYVWIELAWLIKE